MEETSSQPVYQLYTLINPESFVTAGAIQGTLAGAEPNEAGNQILYIALHPKQDETDDSITVKSEVPAEMLKSTSTINLVALDNNEFYMGAENASEDHLESVEPHLLTNDGYESTVDGSVILQSTEALSTDTVDQPDSYEIQLEDGTHAIITADVLGSLMENELTDEPIVTKDRRFPCTYVGCEKSFLTNHHLSVHVRSHTGKKPYSCTYCNKAFSTGYSMKAHLRTHTGEKPYGCEVCLKRFKTSGDLHKHVRTHTGEKPFPCPIEGCGKSFTTSNIRKVHVRSHTGERPYVCAVEDCGKAFASATNYKNHMRIHSGEKPYVCSVEGCGKRFTEYSSLYKHTTVHVSHKGLRCNYCSHYFKLENTLKLHKKTIHNVIVTDNGMEYLISEDKDDSLVFEFTDTALQGDIKMERSALQGDIKKERFLMSSSLQADN